MKKAIRTILVLSMAVILSIATVIPALAAEESVSAIETIQLAGEQNTVGDITPIGGVWAGMAIKVGKSDIVVTAVGRMHFDGAEQTHSFLITDTNGGQVKEAEMIIESSASSKDGEFDYLYLEGTQAILLKAGRTYYLLSDIRSESDKYYDACTVTTGSDLEITGTVFRERSGELKFTKASNTNCLPVDIQYYVKNAQPAVTEEEEADVTDTSGVVNEEGGNEIFTDMVPVIVAGVTIVAVAFIVTIVLISKKRNKKQKNK